MLDPKDFTFLERNNNFDFKSFLTKLLGYWKWFALSLIITFTIAYQVNIRQEKTYEMNASIVVKDENNPFFTSNTSLVFNWGGTSDKVQTVVNTLQSRSHNEIVVDELEFYIDYLVQGKFKLEDVYGAVPFYVEIDKNKPQLAGLPIKIKFLSQNEFKVTIPFESSTVGTIVYTGNQQGTANVQTGEFVKKYKVGQLIDLPFLNLKLFINPNPGDYTGNEYFIRFNNFDSVVAGYQGLSASADDKGASIIRLSMRGTNKSRLVTYLNSTIQVLRKKQLDGKNQFASNTIAFIDSTLLAMEEDIKVAENELKNFRKDKNIFELEGGGVVLTEKLTGYDVESDAVSRKIAYYNSLRSYLLNSTDFSKLPAPTVAGIDEPNIIANVTRLIELSKLRSEKAYSVKNEKMFQDFDSEMNALKKVLLENITNAKSLLQLDLSLINKKIAAAEVTIKKLPEEQQQLLKITRKHDLTDNIYSTFLEKRSEADIVKAANVSDIEFIDSAKDIGGGMLGSKTNVNYVMAFLVGFLVPLFILLVKAIVDKTIHNTDDIGKLTSIPIIGVVGKKVSENNLSVFEKPKSPLAESFRSIRSSLQFLYKKQKGDGTKTLMITSSVGGEGKTFCSINLATVFALSEKKTVIVGLDLRKPRIFGDFKIENNIGAVNYLIGQKTINEVIQPTHIPYLDVITSGPIPPNPSELILGESMAEMIEELKKMYDYIILDTPPIGLVSDALELAQFCDATIYIVRQAYTKKGMLSIINEKHKRGELHNISILVNGFDTSAKYGYGYGYGGYGYGGYSYEGYGNGYLDVEKPKTIFDKIKESLNKKRQ